MSMLDAVCFDMGQFEYAVESKKEEVRDSCDAFLAMMKGVDDYIEEYTGEGDDTTNLQLRYEHFADKAKSCEEQAEKIHLNHELAEVKYKNVIMPAYTSVQANPDLESLLDIKTKVTDAETVYNGVIEPSDVTLKQLDEGENIIAELKLLLSRCKNNHPDIYNALLRTYSEEAMGKTQTCITRAKECINSPPNYLEELNTEISELIDTIKRESIKRKNKADKPKPQSQAGPNPKPQSQVETSPEPKPQADTKPKTQSQVDTKPELKSEQSDDTSKGDASKVIETFEEPEDKVQTTAGGFFNLNQQGSAVPKNPPGKKSPGGDIEGKGAEVVDNNMLNSYYGRQHITNEIFELICRHFGTSMSLFTAFGFNNNGNLVVNNEIFKVGYSPSDANAQPAPYVLSLIKKENWAELLLFDKSTVQYLNYVRVLSFAKLEQFTEFSRQLRIVARTPEKTAIKIIRHRKILPSLEDIQVAGMSLLDSPESVGTGSTSSIVPKPSLATVEKAEGLASQLRGSGKVGETLKKLWEFPVFRVVSKVLGYGIGVPFGFTILGLLHPFATVCGALGVGALGVLEFKKAKQTLGG